MIIPHYYEDPHMLHENTMPNRAYYVPASKRMDNLIEHREQSDRLQSLNGNWKFRYYKSIYDLQDEFYKTDYPVEEYDTVSVPGVWQNCGYEPHQYIESDYPFPVDPPYVPLDNPCGAYIHKFQYKTIDGTEMVYLKFSYFVRTDDDYNTVNWYAILVKEDGKWRIREFNPLESKKQNQ